MPVHQDLGGLPPRSDDLLGGAPVLLSVQFSWLYLLYASLDNGVLISVKCFDNGQTWKHVRGLVKEMVCICIISTFLVSPTTQSTLHHNHPFYTHTFSSQGVKYDALKKPDKESVFDAQGTFQHPFKSSKISWFWLGLDTKPTWLD